MSRRNAPRPAAEHAAPTAGPFIKWAGGKGALLAQFDAHFPPRAQIRRYFEPFVGSAAVFFYLRPPDSHLFDSNPALIEVYRVVREQVDPLIETLSRHIYESDHYYAVRALDPTALTPVERAARFIYLNKTCYNGLYRVNRKGQFNVPFGRHRNPTIADADGLRAASVALQTAHLEVADFADATGAALAGDLIYFDPPYQPLSPTSNFTSYTSSGFTEDDQRRLAAVYADLDARGCRLMLSNSDTPLIRALYAPYALHEIQARRAINSKAGGRSVLTELLITNFAP